MAQDSVIHRGVSLDTEWGRRPFVAEFKGPEVHCNTVPIANLSYMVTMGIEQPQLGYYKRQERKQLFLDNYVQTTEGAQISK